MFNTKIKIKKYKKYYFFIYNLLIFFCLILFSFSVLTSRSLSSYFFFSSRFPIFSFCFLFLLGLSVFFFNFHQKRQNPLQQLVSYSHCLQFLQCSEFVALNYNHLVVKSQFKTTFTFYCFIVYSTNIFWKQSWIVKLINKGILFKKTFELCSTTFFNKVWNNFICNLVF